MKRIAFLLMLVIQFVASDVSNVYVGEEGTTGVVPARPIDVAEVRNCLMFTTVYHCTILNDIFLDRFLGCLGVWLKIKEVKINEGKF